MRKHAINQTMLRVKDQFPIFSVNPGLTYLDSAATAQKPQAVIDAVLKYYTKQNAPIHRGLYPLANQATTSFEQAREQVAAFIDVDRSEIIFTRSATESLNLLASSLSKSWPTGSAVIVSRSEHHANFLPWQQLGVELRIVNLTATGETDLIHLAQLIDSNVRVVSLAHCSNVLGSFTPLAAVRKILDQQGSTAVLIADLCQSIPHIPISMQQLGCDFAVFSGHKLYGPSGIGVLWGKACLLKNLLPYQLGGEMIKTVNAETATWNDIPWKFEAGTPNVEGAIGLAAAIGWIQHTGRAEIEATTVELHTYAVKQLGSLESVRIIGTPDSRSGIVSFVTAALHPHDLAEQLGRSQICIRAGQHCAAPLHQALNIGASSRISLAAYNDVTDIDRAITHIKQIIYEVTHA